MLFDRKPNDLLPLNIDFASLICKFVFFQIPSKPSGYISSLFKPLTIFIEEHSEVLGEQQKAAIFINVFSSLADQ